MIAKQPIQVFKPKIDTRYGTGKVKSHSGVEIDAIPVKHSSEILTKVQKSTTVIGIDEAQFFDNWLITVVRKISEKGIRVIVSGLDMDFKGEPFGSMPFLMAIADSVTKLHAICVVCGEEATMTQRLIDGKPADYSDPVVLIGASESYEARCTIHHVCLPPPGPSLIDLYDLKLHK